MDDICSHLKISKKTLYQYFSNKDDLVEQIMMHRRNNYRTQKDIEELLKEWEFYATADAPHRLDLPALSTLERLTMESHDDAQAKMGFKLPKSDMGENPFDVFRKFYRIYPHFSRVEL